jgi:hypothetical protein
MLRSFVTNTVIALALMGAYATPAAAQSCSPNAGPFCIDKIITDASNSGITGSTKTVDPNASTKELGPINGNATKIGVINSAPTPMLGLTNPNSSVDLNTVYTQTAVDPNTGHIWYYFGWVRDSNNGSGFISIELQKSGVPEPCKTINGGYTNASCNPWSGRQNGDFIILWDQQGGSTKRWIRFYDAASHTFGAPTELNDVVSRAEYSSDLYRGEVAIDFTEVVFPENGECQSFANTIPGTVTGNSDTADYKDTVLSVFPPVSNCGSVSITKVTDPTGLSGTFPYTISRNGGDTIFGTVASVDSDCDSSGSTLQCAGTLTGHGDVDTIENLLVGSDYRVQEGSVGPEFAEVSLDCVLDGQTYHLYGQGTTVAGFPVVATKTTACTITNKKTVGLLRVVKVVVNAFGLTAVPGNFSFALDGATAVPFANNGVSCVSGQVCKEYTLPVGGAHTVVESDPGAEWTIGYSNCENVAISSAEPQTCTVTNTAKQNPVNVSTRQRVLLFDAATVTSLRRAAGEGAMSVTFAVYSDLTSCNAQTGTLGSETVPVNLTEQPGSTVTVGTNNTVEVSLNAVPGDATTVRYWRARFQQAGDNPPNADYLTSCNEITTVRLQQ